MNIKTPEDDEFKLSVLACDKKYDIAFLTGASEYAYGIKQQGAYYDLQDVPNVRNISIAVSHMYIQLQQQMVEKYG